MATYESDEEIHLANKEKMKNIMRSGGSLILRGSKLFSRGSEIDQEFRAQMMALVKEEGFEITTIGAGMKQPILMYACNAETREEIVVTMGIGGDYEDENVRKNKRQKLDDPTCLWVVDVSSWTMEELDGDL